MLNKGKDQRMFFWRCSLTHVVFLLIQDGYVTLQDGWGWSLEPHLKEFNIWTAGLLTRCCALRGHLLCLVPFPLAGTQRRSGITLFPPAERDVKRGQSLSPYLITLPQDSQRASGGGSGEWGAASELGSVCPGKRCWERPASLCLPRSRTSAHIWQTSRYGSRQRDLNHTCSENKHDEFCLIQLHIKASPLGRPSASQVHSTIFGQQQRAIVAVFKCERHL